MSERIFFIAVGLMFLIAVINKVKKQRTFEKDSFYWIISAICLVILSVNSDFISKIAKYVNIKYPPSLLFLVAIVLILYLLFKVTCQISNLREQNKELAQENLIFKMQLKEIENKILENEKNNN